jgi:Transposase, Mutator family
MASLSSCRGLGKATICAVAEAALQMLMEADVEGLLGAARHERSPDRLHYRNGCRDRSFDTRPVDGGNLAVRVTEATVQNLAAVSIWIVCCSLARRHYRRQCVCVAFETALGA